VVNPGADAAMPVGVQTASVCIGFYFRKFRLYAVFIL
jgi:hypothetical protein